MTMALIFIVSLILFFCFYHAGKMQGYKMGLDYAKRIVEEEVEEILKNYEKSKTDNKE